jgi:hypothetical protein
MAARGAAAAPAGGDPLAALPHALALDIFSRLTVEQRLRCIEVCRGWRTTLTDRAAWLQLDLTRADGGECSEALLRAATSRAGGQLRTLRLGCGDALQDSLCAVAAGNAVTLQELRIGNRAARAVWPRRRVQDVEALLRAAPQLRTLEADVYCGDAAEARRVLRNEPPFGPLRVRQFTVDARTATADAVLSLAADMAAHASLASVGLYNAPLDAPGAFNAVVDAALARRLSPVQLVACHLLPASAPALARLLGGNTLTELYIDNGLEQLVVAPAAALLANALRANTSLTALSLSEIELWRDAAVAAELFAALTAHPRLRLLDLSRNEPRDGGMQAAEAGAALAALLLANAPALQALNIGFCGLGDEGMRPVVEALRHNTHLTKLDCSFNDVSEQFARNTLLPAVRANSSLRELVAAGEPDEEDEEEDEEDWEVAAREAEALVAARAQPQ